MLIGHNVLQQTNIFYLYENSRKMLFVRFIFAYAFKNKHVNKICGPTLFNFF